MGPNPVYLGSISDTILDISSLLFLLLMLTMIEQLSVLCIRNNVSVTNESVRICRVLRASLNVLYFLDHLDSFQNRKDWTPYFPFRWCL